MVVEAGEGGWGGGGRKTRPQLISGGVGTQSMQGIFPSILYYQGNLLSLYYSFSQKSSLEGFKFAPFGPIINQWTAISL